MTHEKFQVHVQVQTLRLLVEILQCLATDEDARAVAKREMEHVNVLLNEVNTLT